MFAIWAMIASLAAAGPAAVAAPRVESRAEPSLEESIAAATRPDWITAAPQMSANVYFMTVDSGPYATRSEAAQGLDHELEASAQAYVNDYLGSDHAADFIDLSADRI